MHSHHTTEGAPSASVAEPEQADVEAARAVLAQEEQRRIQACAAELQEVLTRYGMTLEVAPAQIVLAPQRVG
ncbi:hypothetical protein AB0F30_17080 [Streptomyces sp. NPDC029006]|uniref:hypothetical protein n=1 Tax=Streptomyces sp. NPDC029006 TaxID=3155467 RepID=UPI0033D8B2AC